MIRIGLFLADFADSAEKQTVKIGNCKNHFLFFLKMFVIKLKATRKL